MKGVYHHYSEHGKGALPIEEPHPALREQDAELINEVYRVFGKFSAWKLRQMTHQEDPWKNNYEPDIKDIEIPREDMAVFFKRRYVKKT